MLDEDVYIVLPPFMKLFFVYYYYNYSQSPFQKEVYFIRKQFTSLFAPKENFFCFFFHFGKDPFP